MIFTKLRPAPIQIIDERVVSFLVTYGGLQRGDVIDYLTDYPSQAIEMATKMRDAILNDRGMSKEYKAKVLEVWPNQN
jgi:hypothetical protein